METVLSRHGRGFRLESHQRLPLRRADVFPFFADPANLERITPASLRFRILTPLPIAMERGAVIDYRLRIRGVPVRWQSEISVWDPPHRFVDEQRRGPYRWWRHEHLFVEERSTTLIRDRVDYGVPGGRLVHGLLVAPELRAIFRHRRAVVSRLLASAPGTAGG